MRPKAAYLAVLVLGLSSGLAAAESREASPRPLVLDDSDAIVLPAPRDMATPRLELPESDQRKPRATPAMRLREAGRVGTFAYLSTPHPNMMFAIGAGEDASELGRQMDRAIVELTRSEMLFNRQQDSAPFIGLGVRSGSDSRGWSADAAMGIGVFDRPDHSRLAAPYAAGPRPAYDASARAHVQVRSVF